ncbi:E3 ubiquitin-protein ligase Ubr3 [Chrysoperla carnea]|uniref:E3 ubiquitin-protein ligase Ubr3 n=1 Tax=Chrysoperla carnea TaxID=189513 RepID=UPI001D0899A3|nr:E3 ubiquitin-protein ligase Ubr3 [Chrysoperla carnea]
MASSSIAPLVLMKKGKRAAAQYIQAECSNTTSPQHLNELLDLLLNPGKAIDEWETIDWCKWLMASGQTPDEFANTVRTYDNATTCGLVWTPNFVAYRCRTCGISPCMSLCTECFKKGNHHRHDFNMFLSQAGGACDCGDTSVMKETGFCDRHGPNKIVNKSAAPADLMCVAEAIMPRIILRLIQHLREHSKNENSESYRIAIQDADSFITMLLDFNNMGALMRRVITTALTNPQKYRSLLEIPQNKSEYAKYMVESKRLYEEAIKSLPNPDPPDDYKDCPSLQEQLVHKTFLEELVFWTVKFEFPQKVVCLLLNMLPDPDYKEALTQAFVLHYSRISMMLERSSDPDTLSNRVVHVSVQLFSNESLALRMAENLNLLHVMVISLKYMMSNILIQNTLHDPKHNFHFVVDCSRQVMKEHCYWPLVSDLNNVLSHKPVAIKFMNDDALLDMWFVFLSMFQGMNVNIRELDHHVEFEPNTYYAAFSAELEASAYPMWALVSHLVDSSTVEYTKRVLNSCLTALQEWLDAVSFTNHSVDDCYQVSFHLPLHRYFAVFMCQAIKMQGVSLREVLPSSDILHLIMMHPLRVQVAFYEILSGMWVRNGLQIKGQAMTYIQCNFCNSMVDADIYLLQVCSTQLEAQFFIETLIEKFHIKESLTFGPSYRDKGYLDSGITSPIPSMLESCLTFLATLINVRTNLGLSDNALNRLEMVTLLCMNDKTHSQLMELMPERCGTSQHRDFEALLAEVADYKAPNLEASGTMQQGMYVPKSIVWEQQYDPLHVLLRAVHRRDFQTSMDRFTEYGRHAGKLKSSQTPWPPFREPAPCSDAYEDPRKVLRTRLFHALMFVVLFKAVHGHNISEHCMALAIYLLEMAVVTANKPTDRACNVYPTSTSSRSIQDLDLINWFETDNLIDNLRTVISKITLAPEPEVLPTTYSSDGSDMEWDAEADNEMLSDITEGAANSTLMLEESSGISPSDYIVAITSPNAIALNPDRSVVPEQSVAPAAMDEDEDSPTILALPPAITTPNTELALAVPEDMSVATVDTIMEFISEPGTSGDGGQQQVAILPSEQPSTSHELAIPTTSSIPRKQYHTPKRRQVEGSPNPLTVKVNENIISLLLKLHSQLSGIPDSYNLEEETNTTTTSNANENRIGDGPFFVGNLLNKIAALDSLCRESIKETRNRLWPKQQVREEEQRQKEDLEREQRRIRARERQQKLLAEFASKQNQFLEKTKEAAEGNTSGMDWQEKESSRQEYDCVICNQTTPSTEDEPMGLVVLVQSTSVTAHRRRDPERVVLPTSEEERQTFHRDDILASEFDRRVEELDRHFDSQSWLLSVNLGWEGGVHVQTCGHHLHLDCLKSYLQSLRSQHRNQTLAVDRGEYLCPLCRQLANSVLPLSPQLGECTAIVRSRPGTMDGILSELTNFLKENQKPTSTSNLAEAMGKSMEDMTNSTHLKFKQKVAPPMHQSLFLFVTSIARTNLEIELIQRGGSLCTDTTTNNNNTHPTLSLMPKRDCIVPLLHVLAVHARVLAQWPTWQIWTQITGVQGSPTTSPMALTTIEREVPLLLKDPSALLIQFILLLPLHLDQAYFSSVVKTLYNLLYYQVVAQLTCSMTNRERQHVINKCRAKTFESHVNECKALQPAEKPSTSTIHHQPNHYATCSSATASSSSSMHSPASSSSSSTAANNNISLYDTLYSVIESFNTSELYIEDENCGSSSQSTTSSCSTGAVKFNIQSLEIQVQKLCLPFLRIAALLKYHLYQQSLPEVRSPQSEFVRLVYYLELVTEGMDWNCFNAAVALNWASPEIRLETPRLWCNQFSAFVARSQIAARNFLIDQHVIWHPPRLLRLPKEYEKIFTYYHERQCSQCHSVPQETSVCLLCGTVVCLKQGCCKTQNVCEAVQHSIDCGGGTGIYLVVTSTYIIVIRGRRACLWGSLYLDDFEEEDRDLKRGKPLHLSQDRYQLLEQQWLTHRFDHTKKTWVWHRDAL